MTFLAPIDILREVSAVHSLITPGLILRGTQAPTEIPYWPILLVLAILIPLLIVAFKKINW